MSELERDVRFEVLGSVRVRARLGDITVTGRDRVLLAVLLLRANELVGMDRLVDAIWGDQPPRNARNQIQSCVSRLRKRLVEAGVADSLIETDPAGYRLTASTGSLDLMHFRGLVSEARAALAEGRRKDAADRYCAALELWRGPALTGVDSDVVRAAAAALDEEHLRAAEERIDLALALGGAGELVAELTELVAQHPYRENLYASLMVALYRSGRQADALTAYQRARSLLVEEVGTEPGATLRDLHQRILNADPSVLGGGPSAAVESSVSGRQYLPRVVQDFTGRPDAVARLVKAAQLGSETATVLAIDGMPGIGKTALAVHVAHLLAERYPDGQLFIDLHGHSERRPMESAVALDALLRQLGLPGGRIPSELDERASLWRSELAERRALVVLDNAASTAQVRHLLPSGAGCLVLVTSRRRLTGLEAAHPLSLEVLTAEDAVALLAQIAGRRVLDEPTAAAEVARLCGNLPLAIRLAGARLAHRPGWRVQDLVDRLRDARELLTELAADDRSVADAFALSYAQLPPNLMRTFRLLGLHPGEEFDVYAVAALADLGLSESKRALDSLVDWHLLEEARLGRYRLHDLVREYAYQLATNTDAEPACRNVIERLLDFYLHGATATTGSMERPSSRRQFQSEQPMREDLVTGPAMLGVTWLELERSNLVAAIRCAAMLALDEYAWRLARLSWAFLYHRGHIDDLLYTHHRALASAERLGDDLAVAAVCNYLASAYDKLGEFEKAANALQRALRLRSEHGDLVGAATTQMNLAMVYRRLGRVADAARLVLDALKTQERHRDLDGMGLSLHNLGVVYAMLGRYGDAAKCHRRRLAISREVGDLEGTAGPLGDLGAVRIKLGDYGPASRLLTASLRLKRRLGLRDGEWDVVNDLGVLYRTWGRMTEAIMQHREAQLVAEGTGDRPGLCAAGNELGVTLREAGDLAAALEQHRIVLAEATKMKLKYEQARALDGIAACLHVTDAGEARQHWRRALTLYQEMGVPEQANVERHLAELEGAGPSVTGGAPVRRGAGGQDPGGGYQAREANADQRAGAEEAPRDRAGTA